MNIIKDIFYSPHPWITVGGTLAGLFMVLLVLYGIVKQFTRSGRNIKLPFGIEISDSSVPKDKAQDQDSAKGDAADRMIHKIVYGKLLSFRQKGIDPPLYTRTINNQQIDVYDETLLVVFHRFTSKQKSFTWRVTTAGLGFSEVLFPWMNKLKYPDPKDPQYGGFLSPTCDEESDAYLLMTHLFNDINNDTELDLRLRPECSIQNGRVILDLSSVPDIAVTNVKAYRSDQPIGIIEVRDRVFTCYAENLKPKDVIKICYELRQKQAVTA